MSDENWRKYFWWLRSRKVQTALATVVTAIALQAGLNVGEETILAVIAVGVSVILGIAHEDNGTNRGM